MPSHTTRRLGSRVRRLVAKLSDEPRAQLDGLEVGPSGFGEWIEAGGDLQALEPASTGTRLPPAVVTPLRNVRR
jgi:hypothetical protein